MKAWLYGAGLAIIGILGAWLKIERLQGKALKKEVETKDKSAKINKAVTKSVIETEKKQNEELEKVKKRTRKQSIDSIKSGGKL